LNLDLSTNWKSLGWESTHLCARKTLYYRIKLTD